MYVFEVSFVTIRRTTSLLIAREHYNTMVPLGHPHRTTTPTPTRGRRSSSSLAKTTRRSTRARSVVLVRCVVESNNQSIRFYSRERRVFDGFVFYRRLRRPPGVRFLFSFANQPARVSTGETKRKTSTTKAGRAVSRRRASRVGCGGLEKRFSRRLEGDKV